MQCHIQEGRFSKCVKKGRHPPCRPHKRVKRLVCSRTHEDTTSSSTFLSLCAHPRGPLLRPPHLPQTFLMHGSLPPAMVFSPLPPSLPNILVDSVAPVQQARRLLRSRRPGGTKAAVTGLSFQRCRDEHLVITHIRPFCRCQQGPRQLTAKRQNRRLCAPCASCPHSFQEGKARSSRGPECPRPPVLRLWAGGQ